MHHIAENQFALQLARHGIALLHDRSYRSPSLARPDAVHWLAAHHRASTPESAHDFLFLGTPPEIARPADEPSFE